MSGVVASGGMGVMEGRGEEGMFLEIRGVDGFGGGGGGGGGDEGTGMLEREREGGQGGGW